MASGKTRLLASLALYAVICITLPLLADAATSRGLSIEYKAMASQDAAVAGQMQLYKRSYALVIGNDTYTGGWGRLSKARSDARRIAASLEKRGFDVTLKLNQDAQGMELAFEDFFIDKGSDPQARLFVRYAGHGTTLNGEVSMPESEFTLGGTR